MNEYTKIQKRLEKINLDLKRSQTEIRELSLTLADLEQNRVQSNTSNSIDRKQTSEYIKQFTFDDFLHLFFVDGEYSPTKLGRLIREAGKSLYTIDALGRTSLMAYAYNVLICSMLRYTLSYQSVFYCARVYKSNAWMLNDYRTVVKTAMNMDLNAMKQQLSVLKELTAQSDLITQMLEMAFAFAGRQKVQALKYISLAASYMDISETTIRICAESAVNKVAAVRKECYINENFYR